MLSKCVVVPTHETEKGYLLRIILSFLSFPRRRESSSVTRVKGLDSRLRGNDRLGIFQSGE